MAMSKKRWALLLIPLFGVVAWGVFVLSSPLDGPGVTVRNFYRTATGMTEAEVTAIFGCEPEEVPVPPELRRQLRFCVYHRADRSATAYIDFDNNGRVRQRGWQGRTFGDKIRLFLSTF